MTAVPEPLGIDRLLLVGTGSLGVAHLPFWVNWLRIAHPDVELRIVLTRAATRFVAPQALSPLIDRPVEIDEWPDEAVVAAPHVELAEWADAVVVDPATLHFVSRLALGAADTPVLLALQCTQAPIAVAPALPPGALANPLVVEHLDRLRRRPNVLVTPGRPGLSATTGRRETHAPPPFSDVVAAVAGHRRAAAA
ncbi:flavoprotein [uncultured Modestobacter sp.]|uniref:flavoprotein n=1 Tax=uncultured Modestobacter sp. TaxID=380048 RepID=UPI002639298E|nr:flavoprotein [uncultured Modestobacter sp.]